MISLISFVQDHAMHAHWYLFACLMLAGLNFPISEDLLIILSGILASNFVPENTWKLFISVFLGAYLSDWMLYWIGRLWGSHLWRIKWFARLLQPARLEQIKKYYAKYGVLTLLIGRLIPFGVRNCLFATAGMGKMRFWKFLIADGIPCLFTNAALFTLAFYCGKNSKYIMKYFNYTVFALFVVALIGVIWYKKYKYSLKKDAD